MGQFPAFVLVSCLRMMDKSDDDQARAARLFDLSVNTRVLQVLCCAYIIYHGTEHRFESNPAEDMLWQSSITYEM